MVDHLSGVTMTVARASLAERTLDNWDDIHSYARPSWIFRGQKRVADSLSTSFERCCERFEVDPSKRPSVEAELRREFRRTYHEYATHPPAPANTLEWLSIMQHHGAPTRLLDFTYSIYVAAYFALEDAESDAVVWGINGQWAIHESVAQLKANGKPNAEKLLPRFKEGDEQIVDELLFDPPFTRLSCPLNPFRLNERLGIQKGVFLVPGTVTESFMDNLTALPGVGDEANLLRIVLPRWLPREALKRLHDMNIDRRSLFPGLDGYSQSLSVYHPVLDDPDRTGIGSG